MSEYTLMHQNVSVANIEIDEETSSILAINDIFSEQRMPFGTIIDVRGQETANRREFNAWWRGRCIPASREGLKEALDALNIEVPQELLERSLGLSLSDHYWIRPVNSGLQWNEVNFFDNSFSEDIGKLMFEEFYGNDEEDFDFVSPDNTSDGVLPKRWKIIEGERCLIKGGTAPFRQQPINEVIAAVIAERLGVECVPYYLDEEKGKPYSVCPAFTTAENEYISANRIMKYRPKKNHENNYTFYINVCKEIGAGNITEFLDKMLCVDYIIANEDRHLGNFGLIRNSQTLEWVSPAPLFDNGSSLGYNTPIKELPKYKPKCKPFKETHEEQIELVTSFDWVDFTALKYRLSDEICNIIKGYRASSAIDEERMTAVVDFVNRRIDALENVAVKKNV